MIPLTLVTGFLGAGKTTFLKNMLVHRATQQEKTGIHSTLAVVVNEFAEYGLDGVQLPHGDYDIWELNKGSIFCICLRTDFISLIAQIAKEINPDEIWVEATGIADVTEVFKMLSVPEIRDSVYLRTNVCIVDPGTILKILTTLRAAEEQVRHADVLILNKCDTADAATLKKVEEKLREIANDTPVIKAEQAHVDMESLPVFSLPRLNTEPFSGHPPQPVSSVLITENRVIDLDEFKNKIQQCGDTLWRVKGRLHTPNGYVWVEGTLAHLSFLPCDDSMQLPAPTTFACVGPGLEKADIVQLLKP